MNAFPPTAPLPANVAVKITTRPARVFRGLATVQAAAVPGAAPRDFGGRIGVKEDGTAEGCEVRVPTVTYSIR